MYLFNNIFIILSAGATCVLSSLPDDGPHLPDRVFDYDLYENVLNPELCQEHLRNMRAFEFYDASFRVPNGILRGNFASLGNFHQCLAINQDVEGDVIEGKYCMIQTKPKDTMSLPILAGISWLEDVIWTELNVSSSVETLKKYEEDLRVGNELGGQRKEGVIIASTFPFSLALCIPKVCSVEEALAPITNNTIVDFSYEEEFCRLPNDRPWVAADYTAIVILSIIGILTVLSTAYDIRHSFFLKKDPVKASELLRCCSVFTNTKRLLTFKSSSDAVECIDGIRSISIAWVVIGHTFIAFLTRFYVNSFDFFEWYAQKRTIWLKSAELSVDTFFVLSGLLVVYTSVKKMKQMQLLKNLHMFYLHRLLRMFPLLAFALLLQTSVFNQISDGVNWHYMAGQVHLCREYWWSTLLHIQNIVNPSRACLPQTWYLSVDIQLHILSPLVLFWVLGSFRSAWNGLTIGLLTSLTASTVYCFLKDFSGGNYLIYYYTNTLTRAPPFFVGMVFGYILHMYRGRKIRIPIWFVSLGYIAAFVVSFYCLYDSHADWDSEVVDKLNLSFKRSFWGLFVCWIIFACANGYGGPINWFLSLKIWKFMARISYAIYMFHYSILFTISGSTVVPFYFSMESMSLVFASVMVYTVITSVAACVLIDAPCSTLLKLMLNGSMSRGTSKVNKTSAVKDPTATPGQNDTNGNL